jgi:DNA-binding response OmpR family regulator
MLGRVLIVDESLTVRMNLQNLLSGAGFTVDACESHAVMREKLAQDSYALVLVDPMIRGGHGLEVVQALRARAAKGAAPMAIIALAGQADLRRRVRALELGADDVIDKPYGADYMLQRALDLTCPPGSSKRLAPEPSPARVLVVDDSMTYGNALAEEIRRDGHDVILARTASEALSLLALQSVACIVLDVFMPEIGGVQLCRRLRGDPGLRSSSILVVTGRKDSATNRDTVLEAGADDFLIKTHDLAAIRKRVWELLAQPRRRRESRPSVHRTSSVPPEMHSPLFDRVIAASGMSELLGRSSLKRACERAGVDPSMMLPQDLSRALPFIHQTLGLFVPPDQLRDRIQRIATLAEGEHVL